MSGTLHYVQIISTATSVSLQVMETIRMSVGTGLLGRNKAVVIEHNRTILKTLKGYFVHGNTTFKLSDDLRLGPASLSTP